ncbi:MAG: hypothetical protein IKQ33_01885 [Clostridia bacterium]|nr:hypothetical protein [Clostridia bacterium]
MQLKRLVECSLNLKVREKQPNGTYKETGNTLIDKYKVEKEELVDQVSATVYGANVNKTYRLHSNLRKLEKYLSDKVNHSDDNVSKYFITIGNDNYKIVAVKKKWIDVELI